MRNFIQPIAIRDVLYYLAAAAKLPPDVNRTFDIGGPDVLRYGQMMNGYALEAGLRMKVPGLAWLEMTTTADPDGGSTYHQRAVFFPTGLAGRLYWFAILPFHGVIFAGMANRITQAAVGRTEHARTAT